MKIKIKYIFPYIGLVLLVVLLIKYLYNKVEKFETQPHKNMKDSTVVFGATVRNVEKYLKKNLDHIHNCGKKFKDYALVIYENDSNDNTKKILEDNKKDNYYYIFDSTNESLRSKRIAYGRNKILNKVKELNSYDYLIMIDLDDIVISGKFVESINSCFEDSNWDVLTGNQSDKYYDIWAFRKIGLLNWDCWKEHKKAVANGMSESESSHKYITGIINKFEPNGYIEVESAFGGIAIYRLKTLPDECKYKGDYDDGTELCEHVPFHECIKKNGGKIFINTKFLTN